MNKDLRILLRAKLYALPRRILDFFRFLPRRLGRLAGHFGKGRHQAGRIGAGPVSAFGFWAMEGLLKVLDVVGIGEWYETAIDWIKPNSRPLTSRESDIARSVFGSSLAYWRIRIDEYAMLGPPQGRICYVSFFHVNSWGPIDDPTLIHELVHVWQYQHFGIGYIPRALWAQGTPEGYDYGGLQGLRTARREGRSLLDFNYEQQADIVADYYCLKTGRAPRWGRARPEDVEVYHYFVRQLRTVAAV